MKTQLLFTALATLTATTTTRCGKEAEVRYNPIEFINEAKDYRSTPSLTFGDIKYSDKDYLISDKILEIGSFKYILQNNTKKPDEFFTLNLIGKKDCIMWCNNKEITYSFFSDGYVEGVSKHSEDKYFYKFDKNKAQELYTYVTTYLTEYDREKKEVEAKYEAEIDKLSLEYFFDDIYKSDLKMSLIYPVDDGTNRTTSYELKDTDNSVKNAIKESQFTVSDPSAYAGGDRDSNYRIFIRKQPDNKTPALGYDFTLMETNRVVKLESSLRDNYGRSYYKEFYYRFTRESAIKIFDAAIAERDANLETPPLPNED